MNSHSVADPHHLDADPDPDPTCHFDADPDLLVTLMRIQIRIQLNTADPDPTFQFDAD
jgi:hypothetical protein